MRRLFALILVVFLWFNFTPPASADVAGLTPCGETKAFTQRAANATTDQAKARFARYSQALCGTDGLPHLIVDGRWSHVGDFTIPSIMFLYIAGWIGWAGRSYLIKNRGQSDAEMKEILIDVPSAVGCMLAAATWPLLAFAEFSSGKMIAKENEISVSPR
jgi:photosystem I subunit III